MSKQEKQNGSYPKMQNPGDPGTGVETVTPRKHVLIIPKAVLINPNGYDEKVMLYPNGVLPATEDEEKEAVIQTTYFSNHK